MKQKTAIEFLSEKILEVIGDSGNSFTITQTLKMHYAFKEAKDKFREQIEEANNSGWQDGFKRKMVTSGKVYYQQKYGDEKPVVAIQPNNEPRSNTNTFNDSKS